LLHSLDLFTGYGGITLALEPWCKPIAYVEIEEYAQRIIAERMADGSLPRAPILADVKNIKGEPGDCDIIVGGFPCQDISVAGNGAGLEGERSGLFYEIARLTKEIQPRFVFLENVPAIRTRGLYHVAEEFSSMGYDCRWTIVSANYAGAPHQRKRFFMLAHSSGDNGGRKQGRSSRESGQVPPEPRNNGKQGDAPDSAESGLERFKWKKSTHSTITQFSGVRWQEIKPTVCRGDYGPKTRVDRIKALGNGVVPAQARLAFEYLLGLIETQDQEEK